MEFNFFQNLSTADPKTWYYFMIVAVIAILVAVFMIAKIQEQVADSSILEDSGSYIVRRGLISLERSDGEDNATSRWPAYSNTGSFALKWPKYSLRYSPDFRVSENDSFSTFESRQGHCKLRVGILGGDIDFVVVKKSEQEVNPFTLAILQLSDQWAGLKDFEYYLFSDAQNGISVEGEAANSACLGTLLKTISTFKFTN
jgi:hypothetical protein